MTKKPMSIDENMLASEALLIMNKKKITNLCVHNKNNIKRTIGVLHIHNLLNDLKQFDENFVSIISVNFNDCYW